MLPHDHQLKFLITGDLMNSPNRKNMYAASHFMNRLKRKYHSDVTFVLGNHDVIVYGLNLLKKQKTKVVAYLLGENIKVYPDVKMIVNQNRFYFSRKSSKGNGRAKTFTRN